MNCEAFEQRLQEVMDLRESPEQDSILQAHAEKCAACAEIIDLQRVMLDSIDLLAAPPADHASAAQAIQLAVRQQESESSSATSPRTLLAIAASLVFVSVTALAIWSSMSSNSGRLADNSRVGGRGSSTGADSGHRRSSGDSSDPLNEAVASALLQPIPHGIVGLSASIHSFQLESNQLPIVGPLANSLGLAIELIRQSIPSWRDDADQNDKPQAWIAPPTSDELIA